MKKRTKAWLGKATVTICDNKWTVFFRDAKQYAKLGVKGSRACCVVQGPRREMHFDVSRTFPGDGVVIHELVHAYSRELMGHDLVMDADEREEFFCTLFETRGAALLKNARPLSAMLQKYARRIQRNQPEEDDE